MPRCLLIAASKRRDAARNARTHTLDKIGTLQTTVAQARADSEHVVDLGGERFEVTLDGDGERTTLRERRAAGAVIRARLLRAGGQYWGDSGQRETVGEASGFRLHASLRRRGGELQAAMVIEGRLTYARGDYFALTAETDPVGLMRRFETLIRAIPQVVADKQDELAKAEADLPRLERQLAAGPFAKQAQLDAAKARVAELEEQLKPKERGEAAPVAQEPAVTEGDIAGGHAPEAEWTRGEQPAPRHNGNAALVSTLYRIGENETEFHRLYATLQSKPADELIALAFAYTGQHHPTREAALGGIETEYYQQRDTREREQGPERGGVGR